MRRVVPAGGYLETFAGRHGDKPVLLKHLTQTPPSLERLLENLRLTRGPHLPGLLEAGSANDGVWIAVEGSEGESLRWVMSALAQANGFIAPNEGLAVVARVASALDALHKQRLVHGDICPATIFITAQGGVQLHDGGIAAALSAQGDLGPCRSEMNSLAPEQVTGTSTAASDVFRLGLVLYELAVGRPLWSGPSPAHLCHAASAWAGLTREKVQQVPEPWLTLLVTMLSVEPSTRPSMEEVVTVLDQAVRQNGWATQDEDIAALFARASPGRGSAFSEEAQAQDLNLISLTPPAGVPAVTPPGSVVARITTKKMTREMLAVARAEPAAGATLASDTSLEDRAAQLLLERGKLTRAQLTAAQESARALGGSVGSFLVDDGAIDEDTLVAAAAELSRTPAVSTKKLVESSPGIDVLNLIPYALSRATQAVPLGLKGGTQLMVAMADPMDAKALEQLKAAVGNTSLIAFRAGPRALAEARSRLYPGKATLTQLPVNARELLALASAATSQNSAVSSDLPGRIVDTLLSLHGVRGMHARQLIGLATGLARRLGLSATEVALAGLASRAMVSSALAAGKAPHEVPQLSEVQALFGVTEADEFVQALHAFLASPGSEGDRQVVKAVVLAFAFAAHAGEPRPFGSRLASAFSSFRSRYHFPAALFEAFTSELSQ